MLRCRQERAWFTVYPFALTLAEKFPNRPQIPTQFRPSTCLCFIIAEGCTIEGSVISPVWNPLFVVINTEVMVCNNNTVSRFHTCDPPWQNESHLEIMQLLLTLSYSPICNQNVPQEIPFFIRNQYSVIASKKSKTTAIISRVKI